MSGASSAGLQPDEIARLDGLLSDPDLSSRAPIRFREATEALSARKQARSAAEEVRRALAERAGACSRPWPNHLENRVESGSRLLSLGRL